MIIGEFVDTYPPCVDGVGRVTLSYCQTLTAMGHEAYYIAPKSLNEEEDYGIPVILSASVKFPGELFRVGVPGLDLRYRKRVDQIPFDIVHAHSPFLAAKEAARIAKNRNIPLVSTFHSKYYDDVMAKTHSHFLTKEVIQGIVRFYDRCDGVWTVNEATAEVLHGYGYRGRILVMENGTDPEELDAQAQAEILERIHPKEGVPLLLFVGQHNWKKNLHGILGACAILKREGQPFRLVTAGDGPDYDAIVAEARELGLSEDVTFLGFMKDRPQLMALYHLADLLVFPSLYDNAPMVLREAAVMGTPGLVVKGSCSAEGVTDGYNGFISPDETAESIAETIRRALKDDGTVGRNARSTIPMPWPDIMKRVVEEYSLLIDGRPNS